MPWPPAAAGEGVESLKQVRQGDAGRAGRWRWHSRTSCAARLTHLYGVGPRPCCAIKPSRAVAEMSERLKTSGSELWRGSKLCKATGGRGM